MGAALKAGLILLLTLSASGVQAQQDTGDANQARGLFRQGVEAFDRNEPAEALRLFQQSYALRRSQLVLYNIAVTERRLGRDEDALMHLYEWVWQDDGESAARLSEIQSVIDELAPRLSTVRLMITPSNAVVRVDGAIAKSTEDGIVVLRPGVYSIRFEAEGYVPQESEVTLEAGSDETLRVSLDESESDANAVPGPTPADDEGGLLLTWVGAGLTLAFGGLAIGAWLAGEGAYQELLDTCSPDCTDDDVSAVKTWDLLTNIGLIGAGVMGAATVVMALFELGVFSGSGEEEPAHAFGVGPMSASYRYRF